MDGVTKGVRTMGRQRRTNGGAGVGRRDFLKMGVASAALAGVSGIAGSGTAVAGSRSSVRASARLGAKGVLPGLVQAGPELALPPGFSYKTFGSFGSAMSDGFVTPPIHDGMGVFAEPGGGYRIVRNHELGDVERHPGWDASSGDPVTAWDKGAPGCAVVLVVDDNANLLEQLRRAERHGLELLGRRDAVGDLAHVRGDHGRPRRRVEEAARLRLRDGPVRRWAGADAEPIKGMGRFVHEAGAVDPETSVVSTSRRTTTPTGSTGSWRTSRASSRRAAVLQALRIKGQPGLQHGDRADRG